MVSLGSPQQQTGESTASVKWRQVGDTVVGRIVDASFDRPVLDMETQQPKTNVKGNPMTQHVLTLHVMAGTTAHVGKAGDVGPAQEGDTVALWIGGADKYLSDNPQCFSLVHQAHGDLNVGDVIKVTYTADKPTGKFQPLKLKTFQLRRPKNDDDEIAAVKAAEAAYAERQQPTTVGAAPSGGPSLDDF